jgi:hypothetical protein
VRRARDSGGSASSAEEIAERLLGEWSTVLADDEVKIAAGSGGKRLGEHAQDRNGHFRSGLLGGDRRHALADVLPPEPYCVTAPEPSIEQHVEPYSLSCADRPSLLICGDVIL